MTAAHRIRSRQRSGEAGYTYLMVLFLMMVMIAGSQVVLRNLATEGRRIREEEMIWRGEQFTRAVRLYYRKTGHFPQTVEDLQKGLPDLHFLRASAYNDPMNKSDGSWRFIYVNSAGQIIGSVRYASLQEMALMDLNGGKLPTAVGSGAASSSDQTSSPGAGNQPSGSQQGASSDQQPGQTQQQGTNPFAPPGGGASNGLQSPPSNPFATPGQSLGTPVQLKPTGPVDGPVLGGFVIGVGGGHNYDRPSVRVYKGGKTYQEWEFIWNPLEEQARALQNGLNPQGQQPGLGLPIANPMGGSAPVAPAPVNPPPGAQPSPLQQGPDQPLTQ